MIGDVIHSIKITIFSQVRILAEALGSSLEAMDDVEGVSVCFLADRLVDDVVDFHPDIILFHLTNDCLLGELRAVSDASPETLILALAVSENPKSVIACADAGVSGFISPQVSVSDLRNLMEMAQNGECVCNPKITASLLRELRRRREHVGDPPGCESLTRRECEILSLVGRGMSNKEIALELVLSVATVKNHIHNIYTKLNVNCRAKVLARLRNEPWLISFDREIARG